jgi:hypothetical protein
LTPDSRRPASPPLRDVVASDLPRQLKGQVLGVSVTIRRALPHDGALDLLGLPALANELTTL